MRTWISGAFPTFEPWLSSEMEKGMSWATTLLDGLTSSTIGILCVTTEAKHDWMAFEAGALLGVRADERTVVALLIDSDPDQMSREPLSAFTAFHADAEGLRALEHHLAEYSGDEVFEKSDADKTATLLDEINAIGTSLVRDFELNLVLPEGSHTQPFSPLQDMEWLGAINGIVAALRKDLGLKIADHDFATFSYLDMRKAEWMPLPKRISSITTDQLALVHPSLAEAWYGNAKIATETLKSSFQLDASLKARDRRERIWPDSAFLYAFFLLQLPNRHLRHSEIVRILRQIQELPGLPRSWTFEVPMRFLTEPDMNKLQVHLGVVPGHVSQALSLGFSYASIRDAIVFFGATVTINQLQRVLAQFKEELEAMVPTKEVMDPVLEEIERMSRANQREELITMWKSLEATVLGLMRWLHEN